jgi:DNA polymerase-1
MGRRRYFPELEHNSKASYYARQAAERMAINAPIQGAAADIIKIAMVRLHQAFQEQRLRARMMLQVHDELIVEAPDEEILRTAKLMCEIMEDAFELDAPLSVDLKTGRNWEEMAPLEL